MKLDLRIVVILGLALPFPLLAQEAEKPAPPSKRVVLKALQWMQSSDPGRRQAAFRSVHLLGKEAMPSFIKALRKAQQYHERSLADTLGSRNQGGNPYSDLVQVMEELKGERSRLYPLMMKSWKKNAAETPKLRTEFSHLDQLFQQASNLAAADTENLDRQITASTDALVDIHDQLARFEGQTKEEAEGITDDQRKLEALNGSYDGHIYLQAAKYLGEMRSEVARLESSHTHNDGSSWANQMQKNFAKLISYERTVIGLGPVLLEEKLCAAATGHSQDMKSMGFFSHTSPLPGKKSFGDRARKAGFRGGAHGECIAVGFGNAAAAYRCWFHSDGHRHIMLARGASLIGIGPVGSHWTLMTGR